MTDYQTFLDAKRHLDFGKGFKPSFMPDYLFDYQKHLVDWSLQYGQTAMFADCGMGKSVMQLVFAQNVVEKTNKPVLILSPLSVSQQTVEEGEKFGIEATRSRDGKFNNHKIVVTNYEQLDKFDFDDFAGCVCDESSILKNFDGAKKSAITDFMKKIRYRLLCTATAAPNDYIELGTSAEALGYLGYMDMLTMFFKNDSDSIDPQHAGSKWRFKKHAEKDFWRWVASWARACRKPSDLGFSDDGFTLPELTENEIFLPSPILPGEMFSKPAITLSEQREDARATINIRCEEAARRLENVDTGVAWCHFNKEADTLCDMIDGAVQVAGADSDESKEEKFNAFRNGEIRVLVSKPKVAAFGMNWQHCDKITYFPTYSYEQYYQAIRRCWRFGQKKPVNVDLITTESQEKVVRSMKAKADACEKMFDQLVTNMSDAMNVDKNAIFNQKMGVPSWM